MSPDKICLEGMVFYGYHGATPAERELGQRFIVDLEVEKDLFKAGGSDDLVDTVDYSALYKVVKDTVQGASRNLLESVAQIIAARVLEEFPVEAVRVKVKKPDVPIKGSVLAGASVEIHRRGSGSSHK